MDKHMGFEITVNSMYILTPMRVAYTISPGQIVSSDADGTEISRTISPEQTGERLYFVDFVRGLVYNSLGHPLEGGGIAAKIIEICTARMNSATQFSIPMESVEFAQNNPKP